MKVFFPSPPLPLFGSFPQCTKHQSVFSTGTLGSLSHLQVPMKAPRLPRTRHASSRHRNCWQRLCVGMRDATMEGVGAFRTDGWGSFPIFIRSGHLHGNRPAGWVLKKSESPKDVTPMKCLVSRNGSLIQPLSLNKRRNKHSRFHFLTPRTSRLCSVLQSLEGTGAPK